MLFLALASRLRGVAVLLVLAPLACTTATPPEPSATPEAPAPVESPGVEPAPASITDKQGMVSCYYVEIPDAPTLQLWLEAGEGSRFSAMVSSAGSESPEPGAKRQLPNFSAKPGETWPMGRYQAGPYELEITGPAAEGSWKGLVREDDMEERLSCAYYD